MKIFTFIITLLSIPQAFADHGHCQSVAKDAVAYVLAQTEDEVPTAIKVMYMGLFFNETFRLRVERHKVSVSSETRSLIYITEHDDLTCEVLALKVQERY